MSRQKYPDEFRRDAVALVRASGRPIAQGGPGARGQRRHPRKLVNTDRKKNAKPAVLPPGQEDAELEENRRLKKRIAELEMERAYCSRCALT